MKYVLLENFHILNEDANFIIGEVHSANGREGPAQLAASTLVSLRNAACCRNRAYTVVLNIPCASW
jgi:hypothetical protein